MVCFSGDFSSDQRVPLIHFPAVVWERSWAFSFVAPDLVHSELAEPDNVDRVKADLGVRD